MKNKLLLTGVIVFSILIGAAAVYFPTTRKETEMKKQLNQAVVQTNNLQEQVDSLQQTVATQIVEKKEAALSEYKPGTVFFTKTVTRLNAGQYQVDIYLKGDPKTTADAVDLVINYPQEIHIKEIRKGSVFTAYPRMIDQNSTVTVTGVAMPQGDTFSYGKIGELYATLIVDKAPGSPVSLTVDAKNTAAYLNGSSILDLTQSFQKIDL